jgi:flagellar hook protein FlgE
MIALDLGGGGAQIGRGARTGNVRTVFTQGGLAITDNLTDLAIQGDGFFAVANPTREIEEAGGMFFTRAGSFNFDKQGFLSDTDGGHVQGYMADQDGNLSPKLSDIRIATNNIPPEPTTRIAFNLNLDARSDVLEGDFDTEKPAETANFSNSINIFDSQGKSHDMTTYFKRIESDEGIQWEWYATVDASEVSDPDDGPVKVIASGVVEFDNRGTLLREETNESVANFNNGALPNQIIEFDFGKNVGDEGGNGVNSTTSTAAKSSTVYHDQNGFEAGNLKSLKVDLDGKLKGYYTNGIQRVLGSLAIATFENRNGLQKAGKNQFYKTLESGLPKIGLPQTGTRGSIYSSTLEESNVDLATQFVQMIMTQRGFQANSRTITTTDSMMEEVVNLKR